MSLDGIRHFENINKVCIYVYKINEETNDIIECKKGNTQNINEEVYMYIYI